MIGEKTCFDCGKSISFIDFCNDNSTMTKTRAKDLWDDNLLSICCFQCFFRRPEKPYKINKRFNSYNSRVRKLKLNNFNKNRG